MHNDAIDGPRELRTIVRRRHILTVARNLFVKRGFHQTGMAQIANMSGVAMGQIYRDFANKEAIIADICEADLADWLKIETLDRAIATEDTAGILAWIDGIAGIEGAAAGYPLMCEIVAEAGRNPTVAEINRMLDLRLRASLEAASVALAPAPSSRDRSIMIDFVICTIWGLVVKMAMFPERDHEPLRHHLASFFKQEMTSFYS